MAWIQAQFGEATAQPVDTRRPQHRNFRVEIEHMENWLVSGGQNLEGDRGIRHRLGSRDLDVDRHRLSELLHIAWATEAQFNACDFRTQATRRLLVDRVAG